MNCIIIISMIAIFFLGFIFIDKICHIINPNDLQPDLISKNNNKSNSEHALVFGKLEVSNNIVKLLEKYNISYTVIKDANELNKSDLYNYLFAVDEVDLENLMICSIGKKMMGIKKIIALCNCPYNKKIFEDNNIPFLCGNSISAYQFVSTIFSSSENVGGIKDVYN